VLLFTGSEITVARKASASILTESDDKLMPIRIGSAEPPYRGKVLFDSGFVVGHLFR
jgi:hypothetical protein